LLIAELLKHRVSVRRFQNKPVPEDIIQEMLEAARLSPSGGNEQPWMFGVITDYGLIERISRISHGQDWLARAPLLIVLCTVCVEDTRGGRDIQFHRYPKHVKEIDEIPQSPYWALNQEEHQIKIPATHMILVALEHRLGSCWVSRFDVEALAQLLNLPPRYLPSEILVFGYPEIQQLPRNKKNPEEPVFRNVFKEKVI